MADNQMYFPNQLKRRMELIDNLTDALDRAAETDRLQQARFQMLPLEDLALCAGRGCVPVYALDVLLHNLLEAAVPGHLAFSCQGFRCTSGKRLKC